LNLCGLFAIPLRQLILACLRARVVIASLFYGKNPHKSFQRFLTRNSINPQNFVKQISFSGYNRKTVYIYKLCGIQENKLYIQITERIEREETENREYGRLLGIEDNYPKYVLRTDEFAGGNYKGIKTMHIADFLLSSEY